MNKVAILSFHSTDNHGAVLQNYALQIAIKDLGFHAETLDYHSEGAGSGYPTYYWPKNANSIGEFFVKLTRYARNYRKKMIRQAAFQSFRNTYLTLTKEMTKRDLPALDGQYDVFIVGSDQVWNINIIKEDEVDVFTLQFVHSGKRAAYAASAGSSSNVPPPLLERIPTLDYISVREHSLKEWLEQNGVPNVHDVCDPVLLLEKERWKQLLPIADPHKKPYVFAYFVNSNDICKLARDIAAKRNLEIRHVDKIKTHTAGFGTGHNEADPVEFLSYIAYAETVVLTSFHGLAFSIIFEKDFFVVHCPPMEDRTRDLLAALGLSERGFDSYEEYCLRKDSIQPIDYRAVKEKLAGLRKSSMNKLRDICNLPECHT